MPLIRTRSDIDTLLGGPTEAEAQLIEACTAGRSCILGDGTLPPENTPGREIRADVLRYLILGGCKACKTADWGVEVYGAYVSGRLDLKLARARGVTGLINSRFEAPINALQSRFELLNLTSSSFPGLNAQGARVTGSVFLRRITAKATVNLNSASIGGQLACDGANFEATEGDALNAQGAQVTGDVFLSRITAKGMVRLSGASIGGQLDCEGANFEATEGDALNAEGAQVTGDVFLRRITAKATVDLSGASIGGQLDCEGANFEAAEGAALKAQRLNVTEGFFWRGVTVRQGIVNLASAHVGDLVDDVGNWPDAGQLFLDGFTYDRISGAATDARRRIAWLEQGSTWHGTFFPQPYTQLAKVLREMGHDSEARKVLARREQLIRRQVRQDARIEPNGDIDVAFLSLWRDATNLLRWGFDLLLRAVVGYGHRPFRSFWILTALIFLATFPAHNAYDEGSFAPNSGPVLVSEGWQAATKKPGNPAAEWTRAGQPGQDWESFNRYAYAADLVIPIVDLGQTAAWAPSTTRGPWGRHLWWLRWVFISSGWVVTALGAAAITGIIRRD